MEKVKETARKIKRLEIQGATNVTFEAVRALVEQMKISKAIDRESILNEILIAK